MNKGPEKPIYASEIGKFDFCPFGWYLEKKGIVKEIAEREGIDTGLELRKRGTSEHERFEKEIRSSRKHSIASTILFIALLLAFLYVALRWLSNV